MSRRLSPHHHSGRTWIARVAVGLCVLLVAGSLALGGSAAADPPPTAAYVDLGSAGGYSVLGGAGVANTGGDTVLANDLGLSPTGVIAGFPPGQVDGAVHDKDSAAAAAQDDRAAAYDAAVAQESTTTFTGDQAGKTFLPGVHTTIAAFTNTGTITLDAQGDSSAVFVFQIGAAFSSAASTKVVLKNGALANNVFWQVVGAVSLGADAVFVGTFLAAGAVTLGAGVSLKGRVLTPGTVALTNNPVTEPQDDFVAPVVTIDGGDARSTNDTTPPISGTVDELGAAVTVDVAGHTLSTRADSTGAWTLSTPRLTEGDHVVVVSVADGSQNIGTAEQTLTVDVTAPAVTVDGPASRATNDTTPTISGTSDAPSGTSVRVSVAGQMLNSTVGAGGVWTVQAGALAEAHHLVVASVVDAAGNTGQANQVLTVDVTLPVLAIDGGPTRSTSDTSPWTYGTSGEQAGTVVRLAVGGQDLQAVVIAGGAWSVSATTLAPGTYSVVASITDAAQNTSVATQTLTIGSPPVVPDPDPRLRPDAAIRRTSGAFVGDGIYSPAGQQVTQSVPARKPATFQVRLTNRGDTDDRMVVRGSKRSKQFKVAYLVDGRDVTAAVVAGRYRSTSLAPGRSVVMVVRVTGTPAARRGQQRRFDVGVSSVRAPAVHDSVGAIARR